MNKYSRKGALRALGQIFRGKENLNRENASEESINFLKEMLKNSVPGDPKAAGESLGKISDSIGTSSEAEESTFREGIRAELEFWKDALGKARSEEERATIYNLWSSAVLRLQLEQRQVRKGRHGLMRGAITVSAIIALGAVGTVALVAYTKIAK